MDSLINAAAHALAAGDPLGALNRVALRDDAPALALRGIAMAQLGDMVRARQLVRRAARGFGPREPLAQARCIVAESEIALASRDLAWPTSTLEAARRTLVKHGDHTNAAHVRQLEIRRLLLLGRLDEAEHMLRRVDPATLPSPRRAVHELAVAGVALRRLRIREARAAFARAGEAARAAGIPALVTEIERAAAGTDEPAARLLTRTDERLIALGDVEALHRSPTLVVDACRHVVRDTRGAITLVRRPVLFSLVRGLAAGWPQDVPRAALIAHAFGGRRADESHRSRLRVEIGRLRKALRGLATVRATARGYRLHPSRAREIVVLAPPREGAHAAVLALLSDGEAWSSSALALAVGASQRTVQRALDTLADEGKVHATGRARARRWTTAPLAGYTTPLLLPLTVPAG